MEMCIENIFIGCGSGKDREQPFKCVEIKNLLEKIWRIHWKTSKMISFLVKLQATAYVFPEFLETLHSS